MAHTFSIKLVFIQNPSDIATGFAFVNIESLLNTLNLAPFECYDYLMFDK